MIGQPGIFAVGTGEHCFLEFDLRGGHTPHELVSAAVRLVGPLSGVGGVNVVIGLAPQLWKAVSAPADVPDDVSGFDADIVGPDGYRMPADQHDAWVWISGASRTALFDNARAAIKTVTPVAALAREVGGWLYRHDRDLTGFIDGTENPSLVDAAEVSLVPVGAAGAGSSVLLWQLWRHHSDDWGAIGDPAQERVIGRRKSDSAELADLPEDSHVARTVLEVDGEEKQIFRRNVAYGGVSDHGTAFVGFAREQWRLTEMLRRMAGASDGIRCALTRYATVLNSAYYTIPSVQALARFGPAEEV